MDTSTIDQWLQRVASALGQSGMSEDVRRNMRAMTQAWLRDLDIVIREEFEAQRAWNSWSDRLPSWNRAPSSTELTAMQPLHGWSHELRRRLQSCPARH